MESVKNLESLIRINKKLRFIFWQKAELTKNVIEQKKYRSIWSNRIEWDIFLKRKLYDILTLNNK